MSGALGTRRSHNPGITFLVLGTSADRIEWNADLKLRISEWLAGLGICLAFRDLKNVIS